MSNTSGSMPLRSVLLRAHIWLLATTVPSLIRLLPLKRLLRLLTPPAKLIPYRGFPCEFLVQRVERRLRKPRQMRHRPCLRHSLVLFHFLRLAGYPAVLTIGVYRKDPDYPRSQAHGWVTLNGTVLTSPPATGPIT